jgi:LysR family tcuABC transcriptional regulator
VGLAPSTTGVLGLPFMCAMRERYPDIRLRMVEALSGYLASMLGARTIDLAILFHESPTQHWSVMPLLDERLFVIGPRDLPGMPTAREVRLSKLGKLPLILPSGSHGLRALLNTAFKRAKYEPQLAAEADGLAMLMDAVRGGLGATIQPGAALARSENAELASSRIAGSDAVRANLLVSVSDDELSPAALAARVVLADVARTLVSEGRWPGAKLR